MNIEQQKIEELMAEAIAAMADGKKDFECYDELTAEVFGVECSVTIYVYAEQDSTAMLEVSVSYKPENEAGNVSTICRASHKPTIHTTSRPGPWSPWVEYQKLKAECARSLLLADEENNLFRAAVERAAIGVSVEDLKATGRVLQKT